MRHDWGVRSMQKRCRELREYLVDHPVLATAQELKDYWPGGAENKIPSPGCWYYGYAQLSSFRRRGERYETQVTVDEVATRQAALDAFREQPIVVELVTLKDDGSPQQTKVYPKSFEALSLISEINGLILRAQAELLRLRESWGVNDALTLSEYEHQITDLQRAQCWILTTPGCETPFDTAWDIPALPEYLRGWRVMDVLNVMRAHHQLHRVEIDLMCKYLHGNGEAQTASWESVVVAASQKQSVPAEHLLRRRSFAAWLGQAIVSWRDESEAVERAKAQQQPKGGEMPAMIG